MKISFSLPPPPSPTVHFDCKSNMAGWINDRELIKLARTNKTPGLRTIAELKGVGDNRKMAAMGGGWGIIRILQSLTGSILRDPVNFVLKQQRCSARPPPPPTGDK